ncbi:hypothetical protein V8G54_011397, partial [Vigna mungo]
KVTSLVAKRDLDLASKIEEAIRNNESLEAIQKKVFEGTLQGPKSHSRKEKGRKMVQVSKVKGKFGSHSRSGNNALRIKSGKASPVKSMKKGINVTKSRKSSRASNTIRKGSLDKMQTVRSMKNSYQNFL